MVKPFYDFYDYMLETHKMDYDMVEKDSGKYSEELFDEYVSLVVVGLPITSIPLWDGKPLIGLVSFNIINFLNIYCVL
jgi:hypothetical protein